VRRVLKALVDNWPLKLAAIGLATLLYGGLVVSQTSASLTGVVPVDIRNQPADSFLLTTIRPVTEVFYASPAGVQPITADFEAWVDLSSVEPGGGPQSVNVQVRSVDSRITVLRVQPEVVTVDLDRLASKRVPVQVERGNAPAGLELGSVAVSPEEVEVRGPASVITRVVAARANVLIQASGIDVDLDVDLVPVDAVGDAVAQVQLDPPTARVTIPVFSDRQTRTLPITPLITGSPAAGFELAAATVEPRFVTVEGDLDELEALTSITTDPISVTGLSAGRTVDAPLALPTGVVALDAQSVRVTIDVLQVTATRSFEVGLRLLGARTDRTYTTSVDRVLITVGGSIADLDRLVGSTLVADLAVAALGLGDATVSIAAELPAGVTLVASSPGQVVVTVAARSSPSPAASPAPSASGG
jgi:YbbR domain-containing protein